jgi:hypothetical protein
MSPRGNFLLDVPKRRVIAFAIAAIVLFLALACGLYVLGGKSYGDFGVKVADYLLQGALVSILFAILKAMIDEN